MWRSVQRDFEVSGADAVTLESACAMEDQKAALEPMMKGSDGLSRANPAMVQYRLISLAQARLLAAIQVNGEVRGEGHDPSRPQKRVGVRGFHGLKAVQ